jgi:hypothetical protein
VACKRTVWRFLLAERLVLCLAVAGCEARSAALDASLVDGGAEPQSVDAGLQDKFRALFHARCEFYARCHPALLSQKNEDISTCVDDQLLKEGGEITAFEAMVEARRTNYDVRRFDACGERLRTGSCYTVNPSLLCGERYGWGTQQVGEPCLFADECEESAYCAGDGFVCARCEARYSPGAMCNSLLECAEGAICSDRGSCQTASADVGEICSANPVDGTSNCLGRLGCVFGFCKEPSRESCAMAACDDWAGFLCDSDGSCRLTEWRQPGQPCGGPFQRCNILGTCESGTCVPRPRLGSSCADHGYCYDSICRSGVCVELAAEGQECRTDAIANTPCKEGLVCVSQGDAGAGSCRRLEWYKCD